MRYKWCFVLLLGEGFHFQPTQAVANPMPKGVLFSFPLPCKGCFVLVSTNVAHHRNILHKCKNLSQTDVTINGVPIRILELKGDGSMGRLQMEKGIDGARFYVDRGVKRIFF